MDRYRCKSCGNRTRFDVVATRRTKAFVHFDLGGDAKIDEEEVLFSEVESITCRWCGRSDAIQVLTGTFDAEAEAPSSVDTSTNA